MNESAIFPANAIPDHVFSIPELSFHQDVCVTPLKEPWFRLAAWTHGYERNSDGIEIAIERQSFLVDPSAFALLFESLESIGNVLGRMGKPGGAVTTGSNGEMKYSYHSFHRFDFHRQNLSAEPLVFSRECQASMCLFINPDLLLFFELNEKVPSSGVWWDPRRSAEVIIHQKIDQLETVEIRTDYLKKYLRARQMSLVIGHYSHRHYFNPPESIVAAFVEEDVTLGTPDQGAKVLFQNWGLNTGLGSTFLQRRLHLWFKIEPQPIDLEHPWAEEPPFDPYQLTLPTRNGRVAPARWSGIKYHADKKRSFDGVTCDFMDIVYFRQEVLIKYETASGFHVGDNGSVSCHQYWGLNRSTSRLGNELVCTAIGDFAEGLPFSEWKHWLEYSVDPPSFETIEALRNEQGVCEAINILGNKLDDLNFAFRAIASAVGATIAESPWQGSLESLAGRQLKWVYPSGANDDEFIKRATLASTLVLDGLQVEPLRNILRAVDKNLHLKSEKPLGSRNLLQRFTLVADLLRTHMPPFTEVQTLVDNAEGKMKDGVQPDLQQELESIWNKVRDDFSPLAFLYDLRVHGGIAHPPNPKGISEAASMLGLPRENWHRRDFLQLIEMVTASIQKISTRLLMTARELLNDHNRKQ